MGPAVAGGPRSGPGGLMQPITGEPRTPYFLVDETRLTHNLEILRDVQQRADCKILLAQKAFSMFSVYPLLRRLQKDGALTSFWQDTAEGLPPRKYYELTDEGRAYLDAMKVEWAGLIEAISGLEGDNDDE